MSSTRCYRRLFDTGPQATDDFGDGALALMAVGLAYAAPPHAVMLGPAGLWRWVYLIESKVFL